MSAESSSTDKKKQGGKSSQPSLLRCVGIVLLTVAVFFVSQIGVLLVVEVWAGITGLSEAERRAILSETSYWPKLVVYAAISASMVALSFYIVRLLWFFKLEPKAQMQKAIKFLQLQKCRYGIDQYIEVLGTYGFYFLTTLVVSLVVHALGIIDTSQQQDLGIANPSSVYELVAVFIMLVVLPPIGEEVLFRGFLLRGLERYGSVAISYIVTSVLFGLAHAQIGNGGPISWNAVLDTMIFSVFLIHITRRHKSLYSAMMLHGIKNGVAFLILFGVNWL